MLIIWYIKWIFQKEIVRMPAQEYYFKILTLVVSIWFFFLLPTRLYFSRLSIISKLNEKITFKTTHGENNVELLFVSLPICVDIEDCWRIWNSLVKSNLQSIPLRQINLYFQSANIIHTFYSNLYSLIAWGGLIVF